MDTRTTRLPTDLIETAEAAGREESRSTAKQLEHWARFGMFFDRQTTLSRRRIQRAVAGEAPFENLGADERVVANAAVNAAISTAANEASFADRLAARGVTTVVVDDEGRVVRLYPDGSSTPL